MRDALVSEAQLLQLVDTRRENVRKFLEWAQSHEREAARTGEPHRSLRLENRPDIPAAARASAHFPELWWGITVYTCFGSEIGARAVADAFQAPLPVTDAEAALARINLPRRAIGHHRIQPGHTGAKIALVSASEHADFFYQVLFAVTDTFEQRAKQIRDARLPQWGRTTTFDLLLRAGDLGIGGANYRPTTAHLEGSTGPKRGFARVFGITIEERGADWGEAVLAAWTERWTAVADAVGANWDGAPYDPGDFENALCIYQEK